MDNEKNIAAVDANMPSNIPQHYITVNTATHDPALFIHTADLHLTSRSASITKRDPKSGRLIRDLDMENALIAAVDETLAADPLPSAFVVAGDLFDTYRGSPYAFLAIIREFRRLRAAGIAVLGIAGNHDTPTNKLNPSMFEMVDSVFTSDDGVVLAYNQIHHVVVGDIEYVLLPHLVCLSGGFTEEDLTPRGADKTSVLVVHGVAAGDPSLAQMDENSEIPIAKWIMDMPWHYVAFGHYHKPGWIPGYVGKAAYSGSLENTVISGPDVCMERGPVFVEPGAKGELKYEMHRLPVRRIIRVPDTDLTQRDEANAAEVDKEIVEMLREHTLDGAIVHHRVRGITRALYKSLTRRSFNTVVPNALVVKTTYEYAQEKPATRSDGDDPLGDVMNVDESKQFKPLTGEIETAVKVLVSQGILSESKSKAVRNMVLDLV